MTHPPSRSTYHRTCVPASLSVQCLRVRRCLSLTQVMTLALAGAKRQLGAGEGGDSLRVGKPHGAESGFDPHTAYKDLDDTNFFGSVRLTNPDLLPLASQEHSVSPDHERGFGWWREREREGWGA